MPGLDMRAKVLLTSVYIVALTVLLGCHHDKHDISYTPKEECVLPPHQPRFDQPPSAAYQKPRPKAEEKTLIGRNGPMGPSMVGP
jgi:hypothetical protein